MIRRRIRRRPVNSQATGPPSNPTGTSGQQVEPKKLEWKRRKTAGSGNASGKSKPTTKIMLKNSTFSKPQEMVTFNVGTGDTMQSFKLHKSWICQHSKYFFNAFNGSFQESTTQTIKLEDEEPEVFGLLVQWLYSKTISDGQLEDRPSNYQLCRLWAMADMFILPDCQNEVIERLYKSPLRIEDCRDEDDRKEETANQLRLVFSDARETPLRRLMIHQASKFFPKLTFDEFGKLLPAEMVWDVMRYIGTKSRKNAELKHFKLGEDGLTCEASWYRYTNKGVQGKRRWDEGEEK